MSAADDANWELGDNLWDIGCKAFSRTRRALALAAATPGAYTYLSIHDRSSHFVFAIAGVPVRVYRGDPEQDAPERYAVPDENELHDLQLAFDLFDTPTPTAIFRLLVETDRRGTPTAVKLVQVEPSGRLLNPWRIALEGDGPGGLIDLTHKPITPAAAQIGDEKKERARELDEAAAASEESDAAKGA